MIKIRPVVQWLFFGAFFGLMILGKAQFWMAFVFLSIALSAFFGRFYCGWACPIHTLMGPTNWLGEKLGTQKKDVPKIFKSEKIRWGLFLLFLVGLGYTIYTMTQGKKFPLPLIIIPLGLMATLFISEKTWHRYLCPWGVLFSLTGRFAKLGIVPNHCSACSVCEKHCPGEAILVNKKDGAKVDATHCLLCNKCQVSCPTSTLSYKKISK